MLVDRAFGRSFEELEDFKSLLLKSGFERHCCENERIRVLSTRNE